jgi:hypothetical protein
MIRRHDQSDFLTNLEIAKRGTVKVASLMLLRSKDAITHKDAQKILNVFEKCNDISKTIIEQYKKRAQLSDKPDEIIKDFFITIKNARIKTQQMSLNTAKALRQNGIFKFASRDVYEDLDTGDFWKMTNDRKKIIRMFKENEEGISDKQK